MNHDRDPRSSSSATDGDRLADHRNGDPDPEPVTRAVATLVAHLAELRAYLAYLFSVRVDHFRAAVRRSIMLACLAAAGLLIGAAAAVVCVIYVLRGAGAGVATLFPAHPWLGDLVAGAAGLVVIVLIGRLAVSAAVESWKGKLVHKYETRKADQRDSLGRDVEQRAESRLERN